MKFNGKKRKQAIGSYLHKLVAIFQLDVRSIALWRIFTGILLIYDVYSRIWDLSVFYTDFGVLPNSFAVDIAQPDTFSLHFISGSFIYQLILFFLAFIVNFYFLIGKNCKWSGFICWVFLISIQNRNILINGEGDNLLRILLFFSLGLPVGQHYSVDIFSKFIKNISNLNENEKKFKSKKCFNFSSVAFFIQFFWFYLTSAKLKYGISWLDGSALYYALRFSSFSLFC